MLNEQQEKQIYVAIYAGRKIDAIRMHREFTGSGLKDSKDFIDGLEAELYAESPGKFARKPGRGCTVTTGCLVLGGAMVVLMVL